MRTWSWFGMTLPLAFALAGCETYTDSSGIPPAPTGLTYELEPSGDAYAPRGVILRWDAVNDPDLEVYNVYSRGSATSSFGLRGSTTSTSFHDDGQPQLEYFVTAVDLDGDESAGSASVVVDETLRLPAPSTIGSISLDEAIHVSWSDNPYQADPAGFAHYRVYSAPYDLDNDLCGTNWSLEGTTVANTFLVGVLTNGVPRCFGVSAVTIEGFESLWSPLRNDTPRPDGREVVVFTSAGDPLQSGFRFFLDGNNDGLASPLELGIVGNAAGGQMDFTLTTDAGGNLQITPQRTASSFQRYGTQPIGDLTEIDYAPLGGYARTSLIAQRGFGYVFEIAEGAFFKYGAMRIVAIGTNYIIFDWSYQTDPGNPELIRMAGR